MQHAHHACRDQWGVRCMRLAATWEAEELFLPPCVAHRLLSSNINYSFNDIERPPFAFRLLMRLSNVRKYVNNTNTYLHT